MGAPARSTSHRTAPSISARDRIATDASSRCRTTCSATSIRSRSWFGSRRTSTGSPGPCAATTLDWATRSRRILPRDDFKAVIDQIPGVGVDASIGHAQPSSPSPAVRAERHAVSAARVLSSAVARATKSARCARSRASGCARNGPLGELALRHLKTGDSVFLAKRGPNSTRTTSRRGQMGKGRARSVLRGGTAAGRWRSDSTGASSSALR